MSVEASGAPRFVCNNIQVLFLRGVTVAPALAPCGPKRGTSNHSFQSGIFSEHGQKHANYLGCGVNRMGNQPQWVTLSRLWEKGASMAAALLGCQTSATQPVFNGVEAFLRVAIFQNPCHC